MDVNAVLSEAWTLYTRFFVRFVLTAAVVYVVLDLVSAIAVSTADDVGAAIVWGLLSLVASIVGFFWIQGALVEAVRDVRDGRFDSSIGELYARTRPRLPALISAGVLAGIGVVIGLILLIIPGLYLLTRWLFITPAIVLEGRSAGESFGRSTELVKGRGWSVSGLMILTVIAAVIALGVIRGLLFWLPDFFESWLGSLVAHSLVAPFVVLSWTIGYYHLIGAGRAPAADLPAAS
jgi:Membrane domain of glycerophosphoryl diester phosphodiesterase